LPRVTATLERFEGEAFLDCGSLLPSARSTPPPAARSACFGECAKRAVAAASPKAAAGCRSPRRYCADFPNCRQNTDWIRTMPPMLTQSASLIPAGQGRTVHAFGEEITFLFEGKHTGGKCTTFIEVTPPGGGPPPHYRVNEDECFYVLEGRVAFFKDRSGPKPAPAPPRSCPRAWCILSRTSAPSLFVNSSPFLPLALKHS